MSLQMNLRKWIIIPRIFKKNYKNKNEFIGKSHNIDQFDGGNLELISQKREK